MKNTMKNTLSIILEKCRIKPLFLATGSSWRRFLYKDNSPAVMPVVYNDGQPSIDGDIELLQLMSAAPELYLAVEDALEEFDENELSPKAKCKIIKMKLALAKANNVHGDNNEFIREARIELFKSELRCHAAHFHTNSPFIEEYKRSTERLDPNEISKAIDQLLTKVGIEHLDRMEFHGSSQLEKAMFRYVITSSKNQMLLQVQ